jgi:DnaJ-class molecular chaperone
MAPLRPDRSIERCPSCRGQTSIPMTYGRRGECPTCAGQGFSTASPQEGARVRNEAARQIREQRKRSAEFARGYEEQIREADRKRKR